jgi:hypothetical protein
MYQKLVIREADAHVRVLDVLRPERRTTAKEAVDTRGTT